MLRSDFWVPVRPRTLWKKPRTITPRPRTLFMIPNELLAELCTTITILTGTGDAVRKSPFFQSEKSWKKQVRGGGSSSGTNGDISIVGASMP